MHKGIFYNNYIYTNLNQSFYTDNDALNGQEVEFLPSQSYNQPPQHIKGEYSFLNNFIFQNRAVEIIATFPFSQLQVGTIDNRRLKRLPAKNGKYGYQTSLFPIFLTRPVKNSCFVFANVTSTNTTADELIPYNDDYNVIIKQIKFKELKNIQTSHLSLERKDHREKNIISIDSPETQDIDDAYCIEENTLFIYIAEPTDYEFNLSELNKRHSTIYGKKILTLLDKDTQEKTSLFEGEERNCICCQYELNSGEYDFYPVIMINKKKDNYDDHIFTTQHQNIITQIKQHNIYVESDNRGFVEGIMLLYNHLFAQYCHTNQIPIIYSSNSFRKSEEIYFSHQNILLANASFYSYIPEKHQTLGLSYYTHATSPLRRFPDFYNQLCFKNWIIGNMVDKPDIFELNRKKYLFKKFYRNYNLMKIMNEKQISTKIISINLEKKTGTILYENNLLKFHIVPKIYKEFVEITIENNYLIIKDNRNTKDTKINVKEEVLFDIIHYDKLELKDRICPQIHAIKDCFIPN